MIVLPPFETGAAHEMVACEEPAAPVTVVGAPGTPYGVADVEIADQAPVPAALIARTWKKYGVPFISPPTVWAGAGEAVCAKMVPVPAAKAGVVEYSSV